MTDHKPLADLKRIREPQGRIGRLLNKLQDLDYEITYQPGTHNHTADFLSRLPESEIKMIELSSHINWFEEQNKDETLKTINKLIKDNVNDKNKWIWLPAGDKWFRNRKMLKVIDKILMYKQPKCHSKIVVPEHLVNQICSLFHDSKEAGHMATDKMFHTIEQKLYWPNMFFDINEYCETCDQCQRYKSNKINKAPLQPIKVNSTWQLVGIDVVGPLNISTSGNKYIIVAIDYFSKYCEAIAIPDFTALTTANFIFNNIICRFGSPQMIITDQGVNFEAELTKELCKLCGIVKIRSTSYHPEGNGMVERMNKTLKQILRIYTINNENNWDKNLQQVLNTYNNTIHK